LYAYDEAESVSVPTEVEPLFQIDVRELKRFACPGFP
jgi:hypothetical protein